MGMLFISHSSKDSEISSRLAIALKDKGYDSLFLDLDPETGIHAGEAWQSVLYRRLRSCNALVALITDNYLRSEWCFAEAALARMQGKHLFGIRVTPLANDAKPPSLLDDRQLIDGRTDFEDAVSQVILGLEKAGLSSIKSRAWNRDRAPYPGFSPFEEDDSAVFFGRDDEIERGLEMVRGATRGTASRMVFLLGASGSGKSSLLRAGMLPLLRGEEELVLIGPFRPGPQPLDELSWQFADAFGVDDNRVGTLRNSSPGEGLSLDRLLRQLLREKGDKRRHALIIIDQFEELLNRRRGHPSYRFLALVQHTLQDPESCVSILSTLRSDQLGQFQAHPAAQHLDWQTLFVGPLDKTKLRDVIEKPALLAELELEQDLTERLIADTTSPHALPLLALTLRRLWERYGDDGLLQVDEYTHLGGIPGAVARVAEDALAGVSGGKRLEALRKALMMMLRLDENGNPVRQPVFWDDTPSEARPLLSRFVKSRLLVRGRDDIQVAHEALFTAWSRMHEWIEESRQALVVQQRISQAASLWNEEKDDDDLWRGIRLDRALELWEAGRLTLGNTEGAFLQASKSKQKAVLEEKERQIYELECALSESRLREKFFLTENTLRLDPMKGLVLAIQAMGENLKILPDRILAPAQVNLHRAMDSAIVSLPCYGHEAAVRAIAFHPENKVVASGGFDNTIRLWDLSGNAIGKPLIGHTGYIYALAFSPDGQLIASSSSDSTIRLWSLTGEQVAKPFTRHDGYVWSIAFSPHGTSIVSCGHDGHIFLWGIDGTVLANAVVHERWVYSVAFSPRGNLIASSSGDNTVQLWDLKLNRIGAPFKGHTDQVQCVDFHPNGDMLASAGGNEDATIRFWDLDGKTTRDPIQVVEHHRGGINSICFSPDGETIASAAAGRLFIYDLKGNLVGRPLEDHQDEVLTVKYSGDSLKLASGGRDNALRLWSLEKTRKGGPFIGHASWVHSVSFHPKGDLIASSGTDCTIRIWDLAGNAVTEPLLGHSKTVKSVAFSPNGDQIVSGSLDNTIRLWNLDGRPARTPIVGHEDCVEAVCFNCDGSLIASGSMDRSVRLWDSKGNAICAPFLGHEDGVCAVAFHPAGKIVASAGRDRTVRLWGVDGSAIGQPFVEHSDYVWTLSFDPSGNVIASAGKEGIIRLCDLEGNGFGRPLVGHKGAVWCVVFSPDKSRIASAGADGTIRLWDTDGNPICMPYTGHEGSVRSVAFDPSGTMLASGGSDKCVRLWHGGGWKGWLKVCCDRLQSHQVFRNPSSDIEKQALETCRLQFW